MNKKIMVPLFAVGALGMVSTGAMADGAAVAKDKCAACHTETGNSNDEHVPNIAGFSAAALEDLMSVYKSGDRTGEKYKPENGDETDMNAITEALSEADMKAVAAYYAGQEFKKQANTADAALVEKGRKVHEKDCEKCHSEGGSNAADDAAILSGQWMAYLKKEFDDLAGGKRVGPKKMMKKFEKLDEGEREALIHYYGAGQP